MRTTEMLISQEALYNNARVIREAIPAGVRMLCVVKADAYGHGSTFAATTMLKAGADAFAVAIVDEGVKLRSAGIMAPIVILGGGDAASLREAVHIKCSPAVYSREMLDVLEDEAKKYDMCASAQLKIDTGMSRVGVRGSAALGGLLDYWRTNAPHVVMDGIFTHFCVADCDPEFTALQNARFTEAVAQTRAAGFAPVAHAAATSAMLTPACQHDMVRAGIGLYGTLLPGLEDRLMYAQTIRTRPTRIETIAAGDTVGYGRTFTARRETRIMTIPIGYGDGYSRLLSNRADVLVAGRRAPIAGNVCMDMLMVDVTDVPEATLESEVVLMGAQGSERITPDELAEKIGTIPYEVMLGFAARLRKVYITM